MRSSGEAVVSRRERDLPVRLDRVFASLVEHPSILAATLVAANGLPIAGHSRTELSPHLVAAVGSYLLEDSTLIGNHLGESSSSGVLVQWDDNKLLALRLSKTLCLVLALRPDAKLEDIQPSILLALSDLDPLIDTR